MATNKELFANDFAKLLEEQQHVDVQLKAKGTDKSIFAHKLILSARSKVFKKMMELEEIKDSTKLDTITFSELNYTELKALVEFIYSDGSILSKNGELFSVRVMSLYVAADKYEIPHLRDLCRIRLIESLNNSSKIAEILNNYATVFSLLDLAQIPFDKALHDAAFGYIKENISRISSCSRFKDFVVKYPNLVVQIMKARICTTCGQNCQLCSRSPY